MYSIHNKVTALNRLSVFFVERYMYSYRNKKNLLLKTVIAVDATVSL